MKLLIITAVKEFEDKVKETLKAHNVPAYSYNPIVGYRRYPENSDRNWFGTELNQIESILFFAFLSEEMAQKIFYSFQELNTNYEVESRIHVALTAIENCNF